MQALRRILGWSVGWAFAAGLYLLLIDTTDLPELFVGVGAAAIAATASEVARRRAMTAWGTRLRWIARLYRPVLRAPADIAVVSLLALRQLARPRAAVGSFRAVPFRHGDDDALETGRRALAESLGSFAPNTIIIGVDPDRELLLGHQLRRSGGAEAIDLLGLG
jgi:multisubunit Na+/H+ antiporter MnhE subunit